MSDEEGTPEVQDSVEAPAEGEQQDPSLDQAAQVQIPKHRLDQEIGKRKVEAEGRRAAEQRVAELEAQMNKPGPIDLQPEQQTQDAESAADFQFLRNAVKPVVDESIAALSSRMDKYLDQQDERAFRAEYKGKAQDDDIEEAVSLMKQYRVKGVQLDPTEALKYAVGNRVLGSAPDQIASAQDVQRQVQENNRVAVAESGNQAAPPGQKAVGDMSLEELEEASRGNPFGFYGGNDADQ